MPLAWSSVLKSSVVSSTNMITPPDDSRAEVLEPRTLRDQIGNSMLAHAFDHIDMWR
jgi:hypothetical protein